MIYKQIKTAIILLAGFATGCECSNKEEPVSGNTPSSNAASADNNQTPPPSSPQYSLEVTGLDVSGILYPSNKCTIQITKKDQGGTVTTIDAAELPNLTLTATSDINDATAATLQGGVNALTLADTDIQAGKIEKEISIKRGTAETTFTITLTNGTGAVQATATVVAPARFVEYTLELLDLVGKDDSTLGSSNQFRIKITKRSLNGNATPVDPADLTDFTLTANPDIKDPTAATLQGDLTLKATDVKQGTIEKEVTIARGTAETRFTIALTYIPTKAIHGQGTVIAPAKLLDLSITLKAGESPVRTGEKQMDFKVEITSKGAADVDVSQLSGITLQYEQYDKTDPSCSLSFVSGVNTSHTVTPGVTTLRELLEANSVNKLKQGTPIELEFSCIINKEPPVPVTWTNIKLQGTLDPDNPANYIPSITYQKPTVKLTVTQPGKGKKTCTLKITTTAPLTKKDLRKLSISCEAQPQKGKLLYSAKKMTTGGKEDRDLNGEKLSLIFAGKNILEAGTYDIVCTVSPATTGFLGLNGNKATTFKLTLQGSADETPVAVTYTP